ncbi:MAG: M15 family metallopeptidase [Microthrixaceae bacterium]
MSFRPRRPISRAGTTAAAWTVVAAVCTLGLLSGMLPNASAQSDSGDEIDVLTADRDQVRAELDSVEERYAAQQAQVDAARAAADAAAAEVVRAEERVAAAEVEVEQAREVVRDYAVEAYIRPPAQDDLRVLSISRADDAGFASSVLKIMAERRHEVVGVLVAKQEAAAKEREAANAAAEEARRRSNDAEVQLVELDRVRADRRAVAAQLDERLDDALAEAAALAAIDQAAADQLAAEELALRDAGPPTVILPTSPSTPEPPDVGIVGEGPSTPPGGGSPTPRPPTPTPRPPTPTTRPPTTSPPPAPPGTGVTWADVTSVGGIWVHKSIASNVQGLLNAATAAGFSLRGGGYRDSAAQVATRRNNCGPTYYDIYQKPAAQCSPPTAIPGRSMHERGMAIDFTSSGALITSRSNPAFVWLRNNAARFGLYNLPSEPWHWSTNGN